MWLLARVVADRPRPTRNRFETKGSASAVGHPKVEVMERPITFDKLRNLLVSINDRAERVEDHAVVRKSKADPKLIPSLVNEGLSDVEIAGRMGWTLGTLRARCSQLKISLRRKSVNGRQIVLPPSVFEQLEQRAAMMGIATSALASELLKAIARDGLYNAVLDSDGAVSTRPKASVN